MMFELLLGHLAGDYLLQTDWMAKNKSGNDLAGWLAAFIHCILYTFAVCLFMSNFQLIWIAVVFCSHFFIDKFAFAKWYLKHIKGMELDDYRWEYHGELHAGFTAVVYTVTDNTMHLILMWSAYKLLY
jgi:hypothetical protein